MKKFGMRNAAVMKTCSELSPHLLHTRISMHVSVCAKGMAIWTTPNFNHLLPIRTRFSRQPLSVSLPYSYICPYKNGCWQGFTPTVNPEEATADLSQPGLQVQGHHGQDYYCLCHSQAPSITRATCALPCSHQQELTVAISLPSVLATGKAPHLQPEHILASRAVSSANIFSNCDAASGQRLHCDDYRTNLLIKCCGLGLSEGKQRFINI